MSILPIYLLYLIVPIVGSIALLNEFVLGKRLFKTVDPIKPRNVTNVPWMKFTAKIATLCLVGFGLVAITIPAILDLPIVLSGSYPTARVKTIGWSYDSSPNLIRRRGVRVHILETGKEMTIIFHTTSIYKGEEYIIEYLRNVRLGRIIVKH